MNKDELKQYIQNNPNSLIQLAGRKRFANFARYVNPRLRLAPFHRVYYEILDRFAKGKIKRLIISMPPQHGKSEGASRLLPAYMLGQNPDLKIALVSYSASVAFKFCRDQQRVIDEARYTVMFPETRINGKNVVTVTGKYIRTKDEYEVVNKTGSSYAVGVGGALTSRSVDVLILDDIYSNLQEANSPVTRGNVQDWYYSVAKTRLHKYSAELIVFTRWHKDDVIGKILSNGTDKVITPTQWSDIDNVDPDTWVMINFEAIKTGEPYELDPREQGEPLWSAKHTLNSLLERKAVDPHIFQCLYQGNPQSAEGQLYRPFKTWVDKSEWGTYQRSGAYIDVADEGSDFLFAVTYDVYKSLLVSKNEATGRFEPIYFVLVTDMIMSAENTDITTITVSQMLNMNGTQRAWVESNAGGAQFKRAIEKRTKAICTGFHQNVNKEARIISNAGFVNQSIVMPTGWESRYQDIHSHLTSFLRKFSANTHDDAADALTGVYEKEIASENGGSYRKGRSITID